MFKKNFRDAVVMVLALGTAYGLGILSCVIYEVKLFVECCEATKIQEPKPVTYRSYYRNRYEQKEES